MEKNESSKRKIRQTNKEGYLATKMDNILEVWHDFYEEKFKKPEETINEERKRRAIQENEENEADISQGEVEKAIKSI